MLRTLFYLSVGFYVGYRFLHPYLTDQEAEAEEPPVRQSPVATPPPSPPTQAAKNGSAAASGKTASAAPDVRTETETDQAAIKAESADQKIDIKAVSPANLQRIKGIGPTYAKRLVDAGIGSIAQLAVSEPSRVAEITKVKEWQRPGPAEWITEAQTLVGR